MVVKRNNQLNAATFAIAAGGDIKGIKTIYQNIKNGKIFIKEKLQKVVSIGINSGGF